MSPEDAYSLLEAIAEIHGCLDKLKLITPSSEEALAEVTAQEIDTESTERASNFSFSKCQIPVGDEIEYAYDENLKAKVVDDRYVEYNGVTMSLTALAKELSGKKYSIAGPKFFKYKGEWLNDRRQRLGV
jgi:plastocyanin